MNENQYRKRWLRRHTQYEKIAYKELIKGFRDLGNSIPFAFMTEDNYEDFLNTNLEQEKFINIYYNIYKQIGVIHGERIGKEINKQIKEFTTDAFLSKFEKDLFTFLLNDVSDRITDVRKTFLEYMRKEIAFLLGDNKTISEVATILTKKINKRNFYRWQSLRIARTETTSASNYASIIAGDVSGVLLDKVWVSAVDNRTRKPPKSEFNHLQMNGVRVPKDEHFKVPFNGSFEKVMFAGDPKASAGNVINCRCSNALVPRRDKDGRIVRT